MSGPEQRTNPYVGLRPFYAEDSLYFFGREQQVAGLLDILHRHHFLGVVGSSGSGKSSLVRAGLLPSLLGGFLVEDRDRWRTVQVKPGDAPTANLAAGLLMATEQATTDETVGQLEKNIRDGHTNAVLEFLKPRLEGNTNLFLLVDQFEEIFAFRGMHDDDGEEIVDLARRKERARRKAEAVDFVDLLLALSRQRDLPIYVVMTMRTDFLGDCDLFYGLPEALNRGRYLVPRMTRGQLREAIECPVLLLGAQIAPRLLDHLLNELGDRFDRLPVLQHALLRTWDEWQRSGRLGPIDLRHFEATGGLKGALDKDAESALQGLDIEVTARIFKRLTDTDLSQRRVRSPARISELVAASGADRDTVESIIKRFAENRRSFVHDSADGKPDDLRIDISHESLIRQWDRLRNWVDEERLSRDQYRELVSRSRAWSDGKAALLWPPGLEPFLDWWEKNAPSQAWADRYSSADDDYNSATDFLDKSVGERCHHLAEGEIQHRWEGHYRRRIVIAEVVVGAILAEHFLLFNKAQGLLPALKALGTFLQDKADSNSEISFGFLVVWAAALSFLGVCVWLNRQLKRIHHRIAFPGILQSFQSLGGRDPVAIKPQVPDNVPQNVSVYASTFRRYASYMIDHAIFFGAAFFVFYLLFDVINGPTADEEAFDIALGFFSIVVFGCAWLYEALQIASKRQATLGMRAVGIIRTDLDGKRLSFRAASAWWFFRLISYVTFFLGFLSQPFTERKQNFHDWLAKSVVLRRLPAGGESAAEQKKPVPMLLKILQLFGYAVLSYLLLSIATLGGNYLLLGEFGI